MREDSQKEPQKLMILKKGEGLQSFHQPKRVENGKRLFLVENLKKAKRIQEIFPEEEVLSTGGIPIDIKLKIPKTPEDTIQFQTTIENQKGKSLISKILEKGEKAQVIFLTTEISSRGEAIAQGIWEQIPSLHNKTHRLLLKSLERTSVKEKVEREETTQEKTHCKPQKAASYWIRAVMDITWRNKVSPWVAEAAKTIRQIYGKEETKTPSSLSRIQCSILHLLANKEASNQNYRSYKYWEVHALLSGSIPGTILQAHICVPNTLLLQNEEDRITKKIWEEKMNKSLSESREGKTIPQKEPSSPWRFDTENEASLYKHHLKRYPLLVVTQKEIWEENIEPDPPHNTSSILEKGVKHQWGTQKEIAETLEDLYLGGLITLPKTGSENLSETTFQNMWKEASSNGKTLLHKRRIFPKNPSNQEAIHPSRWEKNPKSAQQEILRCTKPPKAQLALQLYKEIYECAWKSQTPPQKVKNIQITVRGPLHITAIEAFSGKNPAKENMFKAPMNHLMCGKISETQKNPLEKLQNNSVMQAVKIRVEEKETLPPEDSEKETLLLYLQKHNLGKLETLSSLIPKLEENGLIKTSPDNRIYLTKAGKITINLLNEYLGEFIHQKYHEIVEGQLKEIEKGKTNPNDFLQYWWKTLCEITDTLPPIPEAIADNSGKSLQKFEKQIKEKNLLDMEKIA